MRKLDKALAMALMELAAATLSVRYFPVLSVFCPTKKFFRTETVFRHFDMRVSSWARRLPLRIMIAGYGRPGA